MELIKLEVQVLAPAETVWAEITNWESQSEWMLGTKVFGSGAEVGGKISAFTGIGKLGFLDTMEITAWQPPLRCDVIHTGKVVKGTGSFQVQPISETQSLFIWIEELEIPLGLIGLLGYKLLKPFFAGGVQYSLNKFAKFVHEKYK